MSFECKICGAFLDGDYPCSRCGYDPMDPDRDDGPLAFDGGGVCGKQSCDRSPSYAIQDGPRRRSRCGRHALEELDGIGPAKAERLWAEFGDLDELIEDVATGAYASSPRIARLDGFSPETPKKIRQSLVDVGLLEEDETRRLDNPEWQDRFVTDGGRPQDSVREHLEAALEHTTSKEANYHIREAMQLALLHGEVGWDGTYGPVNGGVVD